MRSFGASVVNIKHNSRSIIVRLEDANLELFDQGNKITETCKASREGAI